MDCYQNSPVRYQPPLSHPLVLGGEGCAWELQPAQYKDLVWGKLVATAERLWANPVGCIEAQVRVLAKG